nr:lauroyl acyltransferase [Desulfobacterales bacterium]
MEGIEEKALVRIIHAFFKLMGFFPKALSRGVCSILGLVFFHLDRRHRKIVLTNLTRAFSRTMTQAEIYRLGRMVFENLCQIPFEMGFFLRLNHRNFQKYFSFIGFSNLDSAYQKNKGVLCLTAHIGNWELLSGIPAMLGYPLSMVVRPLDFKPMDNFMKKFRTRSGGKLIPKNSSMRMILNSLKRGELVGMLLDQNVDWYDGVFVRYFGRPACTNKGLALVALKTGAPVVPVFLIRDGKRFILHCEPQVSLVRTGDKTKDIEINTERFTSIIESFVRRYPEQWFWVHQRWKTRPYHKWPKD